ncbi:1889_t:CDS:2, partial [Gigaspora rosea]
MHTFMDILSSSRRLDTFSDPGILTVSIAMTLANEPLHLYPFYRHPFVTSHLTPQLPTSKQQLKAARAKKCAKKLHVFREQTDYEDLVWSDQDIDERASDYFAVLLTASKNENIWKPSSRPSTYVGGSKRTQKRKKAELKKAAQHTRSITTYFAPALTCKLSMKLHVSTEVESMEKLLEVELVDVESMESVESVEMESVESVKMESVDSVEVEPVEVESVEVELAEVDERTKMRLAIEELDRMLKKDNNKIDKGVR